MPVTYPGPACTSCVIFGSIAVCHTRQPLTRHLLLHHLWAKNLIVFNLGLKITDLRLTLSPPPFCLCVYFCMSLCVGHKGHWVSSVTLAIPLRQDLYLNLEFTSVLGWKPTTICVCGNAPPARLYDCGASTINHWTISPAPFLSNLSRY